jgi:hypothetical protein
MGYMHFQEKNNFGTTSLLKESKFFPSPFHQTNLLVKLYKIVTMPAWLANTEICGSKIIRNLHIQS